MVFSPRRGRPQLDPGAVGVWLTHGGSLPTWRPARNSVASLSNSAAKWVSSFQNLSHVFVLAEKFFQTSGGGAVFSITYQEPKRHIILLWFILHPA